MMRNPAVRGLAVRLSMMPASAKALASLRAGCAAFATVRPTGRMHYSDRGCDMAAEREPGSGFPSEGESPAYADILVFGSANAGCGVSVTAACCARMLSQEGARCALVDLDFAGGGLDVTLGVEDAPGLRWSAIASPLGRMDPEALMRELVDWQGVALLASDCWPSKTPPWWNVATTLDALARCCDVVIVDAGRCGIARALMLGGLGSVPTGAGDSGRRMEWSAGQGNEGPVGRWRLAEELPPPPPPCGDAGSVQEGRVPGPSASVARSGSRCEDGKDWSIGFAGSGLVRVDPALGDSALSDTQLSGTRSAYGGSAPAHPLSARSSQGPGRSMQVREALASSVPPESTGRARPVRSDRIGERPRVCEIQLVELSVLGMPRARTWHARMRGDARTVCQACEDERVLSLCDAERHVLLGVPPAALGAARPVLGVRDAEAYLNEPVLGPLPRSRRICAAVLAGEGIAEVPHRLRGVLRRLLSATGVGNREASPAPYAGVRRARAGRHAMGVESGNAGR